MNNENFILNKNINNNINKALVLKYKLFNMPNVYISQQLNLNSKLDNINKIQDDIFKNNINYDIRNKDELILENENSLQNDNYAFLNRMNIYTKLKSKFNSCYYCLENHHKNNCNIIICYKCGKLGHTKYNCKNKITNLYCKLCKRKNHLEKNCNFLILDYNDYCYKNDLKDSICMNCNDIGHLNC